MKSTRVVPAVIVKANGLHSDYPIWCDECQLVVQRVSDVYNMRTVQVQVCQEGSAWWRTQEVFVFEAPIGRDLTRYDIIQAYRRHLRPVKVA